MTNVFVYCLRFRSKQRGVVAALERQKAQSLILQLIQRESFSELFNKLEDKSGEKLKHDLAKLSPFVDSDSTICPKGHLNRVSASDDFEHPILLSAKHPTLFLTLRGMHVDNHHEGKEYVRSLVQQRFWLLGLRNVCAASKPGMSNAESC